jgi:hypothetical protein
LRLCGHGDVSACGGGAASRRPRTDGHAVRVRADAMHPGRRGRQVQRERARLRPIRGAALDGQPRRKWAPARRPFYSPPVLGPRHVILHWRHAEVHLVPDTRQRGRQTGTYDKRGDLGTDGQ